MAKYTYKVKLTRTVISYGDFEVNSSKKLTEDEVIEKAKEMACDDEDPDAAGRKPTQPMIMQRLQTARTI